MSSTEERNHEIKVLCENGRTDKEVAEMYGLSVARIQQIRTRKTYKGELNGLSAMTRNRLFRQGIMTNQQLFDRLNIGLDILHLGEKGRIELEKYTGKKIRATKKIVWDEDIPGHPWIKADWHLEFEK